jgi:hypothetical protein
MYKINMKSLDGTQGGCKVGLTYEEALEKIKANNPATDGWVMDPMPEYYPHPDDNANQNIYIDGNSLVYDTHNGTITLVNAGMPISINPIGVIGRRGPVGVAGEEQTITIIK